MEAFGVDAGDAGAMLERLHDKSAWPMFTVPLGAGFSIVVHYKSGEEYTTTVVGVGGGCAQACGPARQQSPAGEEEQQRVGRVEKQRDRELPAAGSVDDLVVDVAERRPVATTGRSWFRFRRTANR
ncbi:hypothetical protein [Kitasatospora sp. GP30]|uniref:hypothetical protein n=1 Tax=Kitasatospora sp. GP30 TaxID=3035084 RepID=UPI0011812B86|nr:hypothetical protein [Kitasatospora sp. GP30]